MLKLQVLINSNIIFSFSLGFSLIEKLAREASPTKSDVKTNEEPEPSNKEDNETSTDPNDLEQTEKITNPDEEEQQQSQTPVESSSSPQPPPPAVTSPLPPPIEVPQEDLRGLGPEDEKTQVEPIEVTPDHPEVKQAVEQAVEEARNAAVNIPADVYAELIHKSIQTIEQEQREKNPNGPL
jgi:hypothetical protein